MREIKFRAWNTDLEMMIDNESLRGPLASLLLAINSDAKELKFMQYTGLKDKNDVDICEGDILKIVCGFELRKGVEIDVVEWFEKCLSFGCSDWSLGELSSNKTDGEQDFEVIGNIYESPELLRGESE